MRFGQGLGFFNLRDRIQDGDRNMGGSRSRIGRVARISVIGSELGDRIESGELTSEDIVAGVEGRIETLTERRDAIQERIDSGEAVSSERAEGAVTRLDDRINALNDAIEDGELTSEDIVAGVEGRLGGRIETLTERRDAIQERIDSGEARFPERSEAVVTRLDDRIDRLNEGIDTLQEEGFDGFDAAAVDELLGAAPRAGFARRGAFNRLPRLGGAFEDFGPGDNLAAAREEIQELADLGSGDFFEGPGFGDGLSFGGGFGGVGRIARASAFLGNFEGLPESDGSEPVEI